MLVFLQFVRYFCLPRSRDCSNRVVLFLLLLLKIQFLAGVYHTYKLIHVRKTRLRKKKTGITSTVACIVASTAAGTAIEIALFGPQKIFSE